MTRHLSIAALVSAMLTFVAAAALRAADATLAVAAVAAAAWLFTWYAQLHSTGEQSSLGLANPAAVVTLAIVRRQPWGGALPVVAAHVVGAVLGGLGALALDDHLGDTLVFATPGLVPAAVGAALVALLGAWTTLAIDAGGPELASVVPVLVGGAVLPLGLLATYQPAVVIGLATAGIVPWDVALVAAAGTAVASVVGAYAVSFLIPAE